MRTDEKSKFRSVGIWNNKKSKNTINVSIKELSMILTVYKHQHPKNYDKLEKLIEIPRYEICGRAIQEQYFISGKQELHIDCSQDTNIGERRDKFLKIDPLVSARLCAFLKGHLVIIAHIIKLVGKQQY